MRGITKIFLIDSDLHRRASISHCLSQSNIHVEPFEDATELIRHTPDYGLMLVHDERNQISVAIDYMVDMEDWMPIIGFSEKPDPRSVAKVIQKGAIDYIAWPFTGSEVSTVINDAAEVAQTIGTRRYRQYIAKKRIDRLTKREREVLSSVANGLSNQKIAERLDISPRTVEIHRANMLNKIGANHTSEAIRMAVEADLVT